MIKRLFFLLSIFFSLSVAAQQFNNEWIDYGKTYYKFKVGSNGLYRIPQSVLAAANLSNINVTAFQLWRNGQEVPIYTSSQTGALPAAGYIEFWGEANDGKPDQVLYRNPNDQINNSKSLFTDSAAYFLTVNLNGGNKRLTPAQNNIPTGVAAEPYFMHKEGIYLNETIHLGPYSGAVSEAAYSASYEFGEGWTSNEIKENTTRNLSRTNLFPFKGSGAPQMQVHMNVVGNSPNNRNVRMQLNNVEIFNSPLNRFDYAKLTATLPISSLTGSTENITVSNIATTANNRIKIGLIELTYPRTFNFGGASTFRFTLSGSASQGKYLEISGFNYSGIPVLYDLTSGRRYEANVSNPSLIKIYVQPSTATQDVVLVNTAATNVKTIAGLESKKFINYSLQENQGNYLIVTHPTILNGPNSTQPVEEYRAYRSSAQGGSYNAKIYLIDQLTDQFAFGIKHNPMAVRNFLRMARSTFSAPLKSVFLIGKGVSYTASRSRESSPVTDRLNLIPTFGEPTSDILLAAEGSSSIPLTPIGRLAAINGNELAIYLEKIKQYEQQHTPAAGIEASAWKKNVIHMVGADDQSLKNTLYATLNAHKTFIKDTFYGATVSDFVKSSSAGGEQSAAAQIKVLLNRGVNLLTYFGHSSAETLGFNMENPINYSNQGKYPVFHMMGCNVGNIFIWNANRLSTISTISDKYVFAKERGSIGMMAGTSFGYVYPLQQYNGALYKLMAKEGYRLTLGELMQKAIVNLFAIAGGENDLFIRAQCEEFLLHGDPAIKLYQFEKPDYVVEEELVSVDPSFVSVAENDFKVNVKMMNLGKAINRKLIVQLTRTFPDLTTQVIQRDTIEGIRYSDSISYNVPIDPLKDKGLNKITVTIDPENNIDELFKSNNSVVKEVYIFEDELRPVYPYNYAIVNKPSITFKASTANALAATKNYKIEVDTTTLFNSSLKVTQTKTSAGGIVEFNPVVNFKDSVVYYWRVASVPDQNEEPRWNTASFVYISGDETGFNQSNYYQMLNNTYDNINLDAARNYNFNEFNSSITVTSAINGANGGIAASQVQLTVGDVTSQRGLDRFGAKSLRFYVINNKTMKPLYNVDLGTSGLYGSRRPIAKIPAYTTLGFFTFDISTTAARQNVMKFLDTIQTGYYYVVTNSTENSTVLPEIWMGDTTTLGANNSLYHKLKQMGFTHLDSVKSHVPFVFIGEKGNNTSLNQYVAKSNAERVSLTAAVKTYGNSGYISSPILGPATKWNYLRWDGKKLETPDGDNPTIDIIGIKKDGSQTTVLSNIQPSVENIDVSSIDAKLYPSLILRMHNVDSTNYTPYQLKYWRLFYTPAPEGAIAPNTFFLFKDTLDAGEPLDVGIAFKNISDNAFDSVKVKLTIRDKNNRETSVVVPRQKPIAINDTIRLQVPINTVPLTGTNQLYLEFNPDKDQPEQYNFNNFIYKNFYVRADSLNPFLDVTFDGQHILNRDIVSSKPDILIKLTDEAKYLLLNNSDLIKVQLRHPNGSVKDYQFNSDTLILTPPGQAGNDENTATVKFNPHLLEDGEYELMVSGKDQSGNTAGSIDYRIAFQVINKPMISNLLNYPNPFTTSTAFVFTLTGSDVPQNIRIQILTITGKIVREITKSELGPLRIGRNITEFKWDGTDQYGQKLANGVYLYRVLTNLNGKSLDKYKSADDNTDKYFNKGYGKMVLIR